MEARNPYRSAAAVSECDDWLPFCRILVSLGQVDVHNDIPVPVSQAPLEAVRRMVLSEYLSRPEINIRQTLGLCAGLRWQLASAHQASTSVFLCNCVTVLR